MNKNSSKKKGPMLFTRVESDLRDDAQRVADREFDGNLSLLVRKAVKDFIVNSDREWKQKEAA